MRNLVVFLVRHYFFLLFLALEAVALSMLVRNNYFHRSSFVNSANGAIGTVLSARDNMLDYFNLREKNAALAKQNAELLSHQRSSFLTISDSVMKIHDTIYKQRYAYIAAKVIDNSVNLRNNIITLNCGRAQGVAEKMGVIGPGGVVGIVRDVSENFCTVMSVLHSKSLISTKLKTDGNFGTIKWDVLDDYRHATLTDLASHARLHNNDTLITTGYGETFPEGITVGYVETFKIPSGENFYTVKLRLGTDFKKLEYVYVVRDYLKDQIDAAQDSTRKKDAQ